MPATDGDMAGRPLDGIRVVELATWGFVPSTACILADWGADVVKIEATTRPDPMRVVEIGVGSVTPAGVPFMWELHNRGKRGIALDVASPAGHGVLMALVARADVFLTNLLPSRRTKLGVDVDDIRGVKPDIVYGRGSGMGPQGPEADSGGYDGAAFWARSGVAARATAPGAALPPGLPAPGYGDILSGAVLAGGIAAALAGRARNPGQGAVVDTSLLGTGVWAMRNEIVGCREFDVPHHFRTDRGAISNPISAMYRTADGRFLQLLMLDPDRDWPDLVARLDRADLLDDPRFASSDRRARHAGDCVKALEEVFSARPLDHWTSVLEGATGVWGAVQEPPELADDPQVVVNGYVRRVVDGHGREVMTITSPAQIDGEVAPTGPAPEWGEHTDEILTELGFGPEEISSLREDHVVR